MAVLTRANIIGHITREIAAVFKPSDETLETVLRGFRGGYLEQLELMLNNSAGESVGYVAIEVDWATYSVALREGTKKNSYRLDPTKPVTGQVAPALAKAIAYMSAVAAEIGVVSCDAVYTYRAGRQEEGRKALGTVPLNEKKNSELRKLRSEVQMVVSDKETSEITVSFGHSGRGAASSA
ncbi:MAG TPA: hypothetical protein VF069_08385 [Streptosporangiaceae bacterium]